MGAETKPVACVRIVNGSEAAGLVPEATADSVKLVLAVIAVIVAPAGMLGPVTISPTARPAVLVNATTALLFPVVPITTVWNSGKVTPATPTPRTPVPWALLPPVKLAVGGAV